jgi:hypothetical protein
MKIRPVGAELLRGQTEGCINRERERDRTDGANSCFAQFLNAPKKDM